MTSTLFNILPVILCGGSGTRLWPLSSESHPKQFHRFWGLHTLLEDTVLRATALPGVTEIAIVCNETHRFMAAEQAARVFRGKVHLVLESTARNTAPAIAAVAHLFKGVTLVVLPSDHYLPNTDAFIKCVKSALQATKAGYLVTFGIAPTAPETGYGYISAGQAVKGLEDITKVDKFLEKPSLETVKTLLAIGTHTWNSGMFVMRASDFLAELQTYAPAVFEATKVAAAKAKIETDFVRLDKASFESSPSISVDYAVFEHTSKAVVTPFIGTWSDLGSWSALADLASKGCAVASDQHVQINASRNHIHANKPVALVGVTDLVVVDTDEVLLITHKTDSQQVKEAMTLLSKRSPELAKNYRKVQRPWGWYDSIDLGSNYQVKHIMVRPGASISLQTHEHRAEHWVIIKGEALITLGKNVKTYQQCEHVFIPKQCLHRIQNVSTANVELIEVQCGDYLGEDDIVRHEDDYGRAS